MISGTAIVQIDFSPAAHIVWACARCGYYVPKESTKGELLAAIGANEELYETTDDGFVMLPWVSKKQRRVVGHVWGFDREARRKRARLGGTDGSDSQRKEG
jgi:hypothetical protein